LLSEEYGLTLTWGEQVIEADHLDGAVYRADRYQLSMPLERRAK